MRQIAKPLSIFEPLSDWSNEIFCLDAYRVKYRLSVLTR